MPIVYTGIPTNVSGSRIKTIATTGNTTPITITTTTAHLFGDGDSVTIAGSGVGPADGVKVITVTGANTFTLNSTTASGSGTGGTATDHSLTPQFTIPSEGDPLTAASLYPAIKTLADRTQFIWGFGFTNIVSLTAAIAATDATVAALTTVVHQATSVAHFSSQSQISVAAGNNDNTTLSGAGSSTHRYTSFFTPQTIVLASGDIFDFEISIPITLQTTVACVVTFQAIVSIAGTEYVMGMTQKSSAVQSGGPFTFLDNLVLKGNYLVFHAGDIGSKSVSMFVDVDFTGSNAGDSYKIPLTIPAGGTPATIGAVHTKVWRAI